MNRFHNYAAYNCVVLLGMSWNAWRHVNCERVLMLIALANCTYYEYQISNGFFLLSLLYQYRISNSNSHMTCQWNVTFPRHATQFRESKLMNEIEFGIDDLIDVSNSGKFVYLWKWKMTYTRTTRINHLHRTGFFSRKIQFFFLDFLIHLFSAAMRTIWIERLFFFSFFSPFFLLLMSNIFIVLCRDANSCLRPSFLTLKLFCWWQ